jgi:hypothetical protein
MRYFLLQAVTDSSKILLNTKQGTSSTNNYWMWIAAAELIIIGYLALKLKRKSQTRFEEPGEGDVLGEARNADIDMDDLMNNINKSRKLYKALSARCHPDRFTTDEIKRKLADDLFQEISRNQRNYNKLLELQEIARQQLNINL